MVNLRVVVASGPRVTRRRGRHWADPWGSRQAAVAEGGALVGEPELPPRPGVGRQLGGVLGAGPHHADHVAGDVDVGGAGLVDLARDLPVAGVAAGGERGRVSGHESLLSL